MGKLHARLDEILASQSTKIAYLFTELRVNDTREIVERYIVPVEVHRPLPAVLREAAGQASAAR